MKMIKLFFRNEAELNKESKNNTVEFSKRTIYKRHVGKLHEIQSLPKARGIGNSKEKKARWKYGCISTKACLRQEDRGSKNSVHFSRFFYDGTASGGSMSGNLLPTPCRRCENQIDGY